MPWHILARWIATACGLSMNRLFIATAAIQQGPVHGQFAVSAARNRELAMTGKVLRWCGAGVDIGGDEMIVMLRANEVFDSAQPDTFCLCTVADDGLCF
jgi:hypothetical protein